MVQVLAKENIYVSVTLSGFILLDNMTQGFVLLRPELLHIEALPLIKY